MARNAVIAWRRGAFPLHALAAALAWVLVVQPAAADLVLDSSFNPAPPSVPFDDPSQTWTIDDDLGRLSMGGTNLFHSFDLFSIGEPQTANFIATMSSPQRVIVRVTGEKSVIDGRLRSSIPNADLFLLNPRGIIFGPRSSLSTDGSVFLSTANVLRFEDGVEFFTGEAIEPAELSDMDPAEFGFLVDSPLAVESITFDRSGASAALLLAAGQTLTAVAGDITLLGVNLPLVDTPTIKIEGGTVSLASVAKPGTSDIWVPVDVASFDARSFAPDELGLVSLRNDARIDVGTPSSGGLGTGRVVIRAGRFLMQGGKLSSIARDTAGTPGAEKAIDIAVGGQTVAGRVEGIVLEQGARIESVSSNALSGDIDLSGPRIDVSDSSQIVASGSGHAPPGIRIETDEMSVRGIEMAGIPTAIVSVNTGSSDAGVVDIDVSGRLEVSNLGSVQSLAVGAGAGADIHVKADEVVVTGIDNTLNGVSQIGARTLGTGPGGALTVEARRIELNAGGQLRTRTESSAAGAGPAGAILLQGRDGERLNEVLIDGIADVGSSLAPSGVFARSTGSGDGGELRIDARVLSLTRGGAVSTFGEKKGAAGNLFIENAEHVSIDGVFRSIPSTISAKGTDGGAGNLRIETEVLEVTSGGNATASTLGTGSGGTLEIFARDVLISGSDGPNESALFAQTLLGGGAGGDAGSILVTASDRIRVVDGGRVAVESLGFGLAGDIVFSGAKHVEIAGPAEDNGTAEISAIVRDIRPAGPGENTSADILFVDVGKLVVRNAEISAQTLGNGPGGTIDLTALKSVILTDESRITAKSTGSGDAGSIKIDAGRRFAALRNSRVETSALSASGGQIIVSARDVVYFSDSQAFSDVALSGDGDGGDFGIPVLLNDPATGGQPRFVVLNRSEIVARVGDGNAGDIKIGAGVFMPSDRLVFELELARPGDSVVDATSETGISGQVDVASPDSELAGQLTPLPMTFLDALRMMNTPCEARRARTGSFVVASRAVLEPPPDAPLVASPDNALPALREFPASEVGTCPN